METYREAYLGPPEYLDTVPEDPLPDRLPLAYGPDEPPVFIGHYWQTGEPEPLAGKNSVPRISLRLSAWTREQTRY